MPLCHGLDRAFQHIDVRIGWFPMRAKQEVWITSKPNGGFKLKKVPRKGGVALQSARNPTGSATPPKRLPVDGCAWVYSRAGTITGWVPLSALELDPDAASKPPLLGPAGYDFQIGRLNRNGEYGPLPKKSNSCGKLSRTKPLRMVEAHTTYLRYSGRGTAFHILHYGDKLRLYIVDSNSGFAFGEVTYATPGSSVKVGSRGWIMQESLAPY